MRATAHAKLVLERLEGVHEAFAYPLAGALITRGEAARVRPAAAGVRRADRCRGRIARHLHDASRSARPPNRLPPRRRCAHDAPSLCRGRRSPPVLAASHARVRDWSLPVSWRAVQPRGLGRVPHFSARWLGVVAALQQGPGRFPHLDLCEQCAPLFGRELARAKALVSCAIAVIAAAAYCATASLAGCRDIPFVFAGTLAAVSRDAHRVVRHIARGHASPVISCHGAAASAIVVVTIVWARQPWIAAGFAAIAAILSVTAVRRSARALRSGLKRPAAFVKRVAAVRRSRVFRASRD